MCGTTLPTEQLAMSSAETDGCPETDGTTSLEDAAEELMKYRKTMQIACHKSRYYRIDGKCNNLKNTRWGAAYEPYVRELPDQYADGLTIPRLYATGTSDRALPSARKVSTTCFPSVAEEDEGDLDPLYNQNVMQFGQYFSHDLGLTPVMKGFNCCRSLDADGFHPDTFHGRPCFPILIPKGDRHFNQSCMVFNRSIYEKDELGVAQQLNADTHFIDQSTVYGSTYKSSHSIRTFKHGKLRTNGADMLPLNVNNTHKCLLNKPLTSCPMSGDNRVNVWPGLTTTHVIFHLEHNRVAEALHKVHPKWDDERLFQEARAIVIAETQNLVFSEFLPIVLGDDVMSFFGLNKGASYNASLNPSIINSFLTAAFRFGHSQINNVYHLSDAEGDLAKLQNLYFRPDRVMSQQSGRPQCKELIVSLMARQSQKLDPTFAEGLMDFLFIGVDRVGHSTDLGARNVQRGRDHGLPPYLDFLDRAQKEFGDSDFISKVVVPDCAAGLYRSVKDIDLFVGGLYESPVRGGVVGPTFAYLIGKQFKHLREGDRLFFDTKRSNAGFTKAQVKSIKRTTYAGIICRTMKLDKIQTDAFRIPDDRKNTFVDCDTLPDVDFSLWR
ncbi:chorion peroxidase-like [Littorina saxatilis]|uniref:Peroxinectin n=1 Tax=Littorina saxatilis TaxID=31220 RepID=A0AAN9ATW2_9CAEN